MLILINKLASFSKSTSQRGEDRGGKYLMRVITGKDKDGSPQYRYIRSEEELKAYKKRHKDTKITHEDQKKKAGEIENKAKESKDDSSEDKDQKSKKEKKPYILDSKKKEDKVKKGVYVI